MQQAPIRSELSLPWFSLVAGTCARAGVRLCTSILFLYRVVVSPLLGPTCRFYPSCSAYALTAIEKYGVATGIGLTVKRLARCHPWHPGGCDPVP